MRGQDIYSSQYEATTSPSLVKVKKQKEKDLAKKYYIKRRSKQPFYVGSLSITREANLVF